MFDLTLIKDLTEMLAKSLTFPDLESIGKYFFKNYNSHKLLGLADTQTVSTLTAAKLIVDECIENKKINDLFVFTIELDGTRLNGRIVKLIGLDNILYRLSRTGVYFDFSKRKFSTFNEDKRTLINWGALRDDKEYPIVIASIDICQNSELVKKYQPSIMEKVYYQLWEYLKKKNIQYDGRLWSWAGDGGIMAYRNLKGPSFAVSCCLEIILALPIFNAWTSKPIPDEIKIRIGMDMGQIKFFSDTGRIVSDVINYAAHLEKKGTDPNGLSISEEIYRELNPFMRNIFKTKKEFEGKNAYTVIFDYNKGLC